MGVVARLKALVGRQRRYRGLRPNLGGMQMIRFRLSGSSRVVTVAGGLGWWSSTDAGAAGKSAAKASRPQAPLPTVKEPIRLTPEGSAPRE